MLAPVCMHFYYTTVCVSFLGQRDLIHYRVSLEAHERESSLWVLKFILFLSAPVRLTNPSAPRVQTIPQDSESTHQSYLGLCVHEVESGRLLLKGLPAVSERVLLQDKLERHKSQCGDNRFLPVSRGCTFGFFGTCSSMISIKVSAVQNKKKKTVHETKCQMISKPWKRIPLFYINLVFTGSKIWDQCNI